MRLEPRSDLNSRRKFPRLFLAQLEMHQSELLQDVKIQWPDRSFSGVSDMSYAGLVVPSQGLVTKMKLGQILDCRLRLDNVKEALPLKLRVMRLTAQSLFLTMDSISTEGRIQLDQPVKDDLVIKNLQRKDVSLLMQPMRGDLWWHGPFDTNFVLWKKPDGGLLKALFEYDSLVMFIDDGKLSLAKSASTTEESQGYAGAWMAPPMNKVAMGASWMDRLHKIVAEKALTDTDVKWLDQVLNALRAS